MSSQQSFGGMNQLKIQNNHNSHSRQGSNSHQFMTQFLSQKQQPSSTTRDSSLTQSQINQQSYNALNVLNSVALLNQNAQKCKMQQKPMNHSTSHHKKDRNFSASDLHQMMSQGGANQQQSASNLKSYNQLKKTIGMGGAQSPASQQSIFQSSSNQILMNNINLIQSEMKKDNIQKAIDNLKHFIKGSFPKNTIQQHKNNSSKVCNQNPKHTAHMNRPGINGNQKQREFSEDPRVQLASSFFNKNQIQLQPDTQPSDDEDQEVSNRRNPHDPIPAFTSFEVAKKLRYRSEDRYINDRMEKELIAYKQEIEKRFQKSSMKNFAFPRQQTQINPVFFQSNNMVDDEQFSMARREHQSIQPIQQKIQGNKSTINQQQQTHRNLQNKENINSDQKIHHYSIQNAGNSPQSPYGYQIDPKNQPGNSCTMTDYKKILSQFLSTSISNQKHQQNNGSSKVKQSTSQNTQSIINHQRSQSSGLQQSCSMISQRVLANAKQTLQEQILKKSNVHQKKHTNTFIEGKSTHKITEESSQYNRQMTEFGDNEDFAPIEIEELNGGGLDQYQTGALHNQMKTFDYSYKESINKNPNHGSYIQKGFQTSTSHNNQGMRRELTNDGNKKPSTSKDHQLIREPTFDGSSMNQKNINKAADYFKTFYHKPKQSKPAKNETRSNNNRNTINTTNSMISNGINSNDLSNPFATMSSVGSINYTANGVYNTSQKKVVQYSHKTQQSISKLANQQPAVTQISANPFGLQVNLKSLVQESQQKGNSGVTRNNKLTNGQGIHVRAKTTADFEAEIQQCAKQLQQQSEENDYYMRGNNNIDFSGSNQNQHPNIIKPSTLIDSSNKQSFINKKQKKPTQQQQSSTLNAHKVQKKNVVHESSKTITQHHSRASHNELHHISSLKLSKNNQMLDQKQVACNGLQTDRHNPYQYTTQNSQQLLYSNREQQRHANRRNENVQSNVQSATRSSCPYQDNMKSEHLVSSQIYDAQTTSSSNAMSGNLKQIFSTFSTIGTNSAKVSGRKAQQKQQAEQQQMTRSGSKRDFKVKCMKIDLSKQIEYCTTEQN